MRDLSFHALFAINLVGQVTLATLLGLGASRWLRKRPAPVRYGPLLASLILVLVSPALVWMAGRLGLGWLNLAEAPAPFPLALAAEALPSPLASSPGSAPPALASAGAWPTNWAAWACGIAAWIWLVGSATALVLLGRGFATVLRLRRTLRAPQDPRLDTLVARVSSWLELPQRPEVRVSPQTPTPLSLGLIQPVIVLPDSLEFSLGERELQGILLHEAGHIVRRDQLIGILQRLAGAAFWWHPLVRHLNDRLSEAQEEICDNYVLQFQGGGDSFARCLVDLAEQAAAYRPLPATVRLALPQHVHFEERVKNLLRKERNTMTRMSLSAISLAACFGLATGAAMLGCNATQGKGNGNMTTTSAGEAAQLQVVDSQREQVTIRMTDEHPPAHPPAGQIGVLISPIENGGKAADDKKVIYVIKGKEGEKPQAILLGKAPADPSAPEQKTPAAMGFLIQGKSGEGLLVSKAVENKPQQLVNVDIEFQENGKTIMHPRLSLVLGRRGNATIGGGEQGELSLTTKVTPAPQGLMTVQIQLEKDGTSVSETSLAITPGKPVTFTVKEGAIERTFTVTVEPIQENQKPPAGR